MRCLTTAALLLALLAVGVQTAPMDLPIGKVLEAGASKPLEDGFAQLGLAHNGPIPPALQHPAEAAQALRVSVPSAAELEVPHQSVYDRMPSTPRGSGPIRTFRGSLRDAASPYAGPETQRLDRLNRISSQERWQGLAGKLLSKKAKQRLLRGALKQEVKDVQDDGAGTAHARLWRQPSLNQQQWDQQLSAYQAERSSDLSRGNERPATVHGTSRFNDDHLKDTASSRFNYKHR